MEFGERMREVRKQKDIKLVQITKETGISNGNLSMIETGKVEPKLSTIKGICKALSISADYLIFGKVPEIIYDANTDPRYRYLNEEDKEQIEYLLDRAEKRANNK